MSLISSSPSALLGPLEDQPCCRTLRRHVSFISQPPGHSGLRSDFWLECDHIVVTLSVGAPYVPTVLPTVGSMELPLPGFSRDPVKARCVAMARILEAESGAYFNLVIQCCTENPDSGGEVTVVPEIRTCRPN